MTETLLYLIIFFGITKCIVQNCIGYGYTTNSRDKNNIFTFLNIDK